MDTCGQRAICASWSLVIAEGLALGAFASPAESAREKHDATTSVKSCSWVVVETETMVTSTVATTFGVARGEDGPPTCVAVEMPVWRAAVRALGSRPDLGRVWRR